MIEVVEDVIQESRQARAGWQARPSGRADYVVSFDKDLLSLGEYEGTRIVTPGDFLDRLRQASDY